MAMARPTSSRIDSSSSAIRIRAITTPLDSCASGNIALVEEAHVNTAGLGRRRGQSRPKPGFVAGIESRLFQHRAPGIDFGTVSVAHNKAHARNRRRDA